MTFLKRRYYFVRKVLKYSSSLIGWLARTGQVKVLSYVIRQHFIPVVKARDGHDAVNVFISPKPGFTEDAEEVFSEMNRFNVYLWDRKITKAIAYAFLPGEVSDNNYVCNGDPYKESKSAYRELLDLLIPEINKHLKIGVFMTGNTGYAREQELRKALCACNIPFLVLHKENVKSDGWSEFYNRIYRERREPYREGTVCLYNQSEKSLQVQSGMVKAEHAFVTGMPRLDRIHRWRRKESNSERVTQRKKVLFFSFGAKTALPYIQNKVGLRFETTNENYTALGWHQLYESTHQAMLTLAEKYPEIDVVLKTKQNRLAVDTLQKVFGESTLPQNMKIVVGGDAWGHIKQADVVCGFNTTAIFEAMAAGVPVIIPNYEEASAKSHELFLVELGGSVSIASSPEDLISKICKALSGPRPESRNLGREQEKTLDFWLGNADGRAAERVRGVLDKVLAV